MEADFYKNWSDNLRSREKQKCSLQNDALHLREKPTSMLMQLQDLVHPKKWIVLEEAKERISSEAAYLKGIKPQPDCGPNPNYKTVLKIDIDEIESVIKEADEFLEQNRISSGVNLL